MSDNIPDPVIRTTRAGTLDAELVADFHAAVTARGLDSTNPPVITATGVTYEREDGGVDLTFDWDQGLEIHVGVNAFGMGSDLHHERDWTDFWARVDATMTTHSITADDLRAAR